MIVLPACHGVYAITTPDGATYVGSASNVQRRVAQHFSRLRAGKHTNESLSAAAAAHGLGALSTMLVECCDPGDLLNVEQKWINLLAPSLNRTHCARSPMYDPGVARKVGDALRGRSVRPEWRAAISATKAGRTLSASHRAAISRAQVGVRKPEEFRARLASAKRKPVKQLCPETGNVVASFASAKDASVATGATRSRISNCCNGKSMHAAGYAWRFA